MFRFLIPSSVVRFDPFALCVMADFVGSRDNIYFFVIVVPYQKNPREILLPHCLPKEGFLFYRTISMKAGMSFGRLLDRLRAAAASVALMNDTDFIRSDCFDFHPDTSYPFDSIFTTRNGKERTTVKGAVRMRVSE